MSLPGFIQLMWNLRPWDLEFQRFILSFITHYIGPKQVANAI